MMRNHDHTFTSAVYYKKMLVDITQKPPQAPATRH
jgi:hypothetical protein